MEHESTRSLEILLYYSRALLPNPVYMAISWLGAVAPLGPVFTVSLPVNQQTFRVQIWKWCPSSYPPFGKEANIILPKCQIAPSKQIKINLYISDKKNSLFFFLINPSISLSGTLLHTHTQIDAPFTTVLLFVFLRTAESTHWSPSMFSLLCWPHGAWPCNIH